MMLKIISSPRLHPTLTKLPSTQNEPENIQFGGLLLILGAFVLALMSLFLQVPGDGYSQHAMRRQLQSAEEFGITRFTYENFYPLVYGLEKVGDSFQILGGQAYQPKRSSYPFTLQIDGQSGVVKAASFEEGNSAYSMSSSATPTLLQQRTPVQRLVLAQTINRGGSRLRIRSMSMDQETLFWERLSDYSFSGMVLQNETFYLGFGQKLAAFNATDASFLWGSDVANSTGFSFKKILPIEGGDVVTLSESTNVLPATSQIILSRINQTSRHTVWSKQAVFFKPPGISNPASYTAYLASCGDDICLQTPTAQSGVFNYHTFYTNGTEKAGIQFDFSLMDKAAFPVLMPGGNVVFAYRYAANYFAVFDLKTQTYGSVFSEGVIAGASGSDYWPTQPTENLPFASIWLSHTENTSMTQFAMARGFNKNTLLFERFPIVPGQTISCLKKLGFSEIFPAPILRTLEPRGFWIGNVTQERTPFTTRLYSLSTTPFHSIPFDLDQVPNTQCTDPIPPSAGGGGDTDSSIFAWGGGIGGVVIVGLVIACVRQSCDHSPKAQVRNVEIELESLQRELEFARVRLNELPVSARCTLEYQNRESDVFGYENQIAQTRSALSRAERVLAASTS